MSWGKGGVSYFYTDAMEGGTDTCAHSAINKTKQNTGYKLGVVLVERSRSVDDGPRVEEARVRADSSSV